MEEAKSNEDAGLKLFTGKDNLLRDFKQNIPHSN